jgi:hypothetical protein
VFSPTLVGEFVKDTANMDLDVGGEMSMNCRNRYRDWRKWTPVGWDIFGGERIEQVSDDLSF